MLRKKEMIDEFRKRLKALRLQRGISARDMSLSLNKSESLINQIENSRILPSISFFFEICIFLQISPEDFFSQQDANGSQGKELQDLIEDLSPEQVQALIGLIKILKK